MKHIDPLEVLREPRGRLVKYPVTPVIWVTRSKGHYCWPNHKLDSRAECVYLDRGMIGMNPKRLHTLIALVLLICMICPYAEMALHSNSCIFVSGNDNESSLALLLLIIELAFALGKLLVVLLPRILGKLSLVYSGRLTLPTLSFTIVPPDTSPPLALRI